MQMAPWQKTSTSTPVAQMAAISGRESSRATVTREQPNTRAASSTAGAAWAPAWVDR